MLASLQLLGFTRWAWWEISSIADSKSEGVVASLEKGFKLLSGFLVQEDKFGPSRTGTQYITVGYSPQAVRPTKSESETLPDVNPTSLKEKAILA